MLKTKIKRAKKKKQGNSGALWKQKEISYSLNKHQNILYKYQWGKVSSF
jgi:hypothetical protein